jgi:hypothetical protein
MRFSGHESFACRYAWLPKAYREICKNPNTFGDEQDAMVRLGVGKNMVRSIRFWVEVTAVAMQSADRSLSPTDFGQAVFSEVGFDPFLEDERTLWLLHWNIAARRGDDALFAWEFLLNRWPYPELTRSEALAALEREVRRLNEPHSSVTLAQHLDVFLHTYVATRGVRASFEDSLDCPLAELELLHPAGERRIGGSGRRDTIYAFRREAKPEITPALFEYCLDDFWRRNHPDEATLTFRDVALAPGSIGQIFKLPEDDIRARLDRYTRADAKLPFAYQPSAVQGLLARRGANERVNLLERVYQIEADVA